MRSNGTLLAAPVRFRSAPVDAPSGHRALTRGKLSSWIESAGDLFWIRPAALVLVGLVLGEVVVWVEPAGRSLPDPFAGWVYGGGESGARAVLTAVASSTITVAGTIFSITVAALSLASGQMGPRLLRNFVRDPGNQYALGVFLGTYVFALMVLRTVRSEGGTPFVPHVGVSVALLLALLCVATLVWFVHHVATGINVETVLDVVHRELSDAMRSLGGNAPAAAPSQPPPSGRAVVLHERGYLRAVEEDGLADWAAERGAVLVLLVRPGDYLFPGQPVAVFAGAEPVDDADVADRVRNAFATGPLQAAAHDLEFAVRQLVEMALRALSPGINDPFTAISVLDRLGAALCELVPRHLPGPVVVRDGRPVLHRGRPILYADLCDAMFHMIRSAATGSPAVLIRLVDVLARVLLVERAPERRAELLRHARLALDAGRQAGLLDADRVALEARYAGLASVS